MSMTSETTPTYGEAFQDLPALSRGAFLRHNQTLPCTAPGCEKLRRAMYPYCNQHYRRWSSHGSLTKGNLHHKKHLKTYLAKARKVLDAALESRHPQALAGIEALRRMTDRKAVRERSEFEYLRRLMVPGTDLRDIVVYVAAVCAYLYQHDEEGYEDPIYLSAQITRRLLFQVPSKPGEHRTMKRTRALADAILEAIGPLVSLITSTIVKREREWMTPARRESIRRRMEAGWKTTAGGRAQQPTNKENTE